MQVDIVEQRSIPVDMDLPLVVTDLLLVVTDLLLVVTDLLLVVTDLLLVVLVHMVEVFNNKVPVLVNFHLREYRHHLASHPMLPVFMFKI
jgi:hypothetical protein